MNNFVDLKRLQWNRDYFENNCSCIKHGDIVKLDSGVSNHFAIGFYEKHCQCTSNYVHLFEYQDLSTEHGTGRTTTMIRNAPENAFIVFPHDNHRIYVRNILIDEGRNDLTFVSSSKFLDGIRRFEIPSRIVVLFDHSVYEFVTDKRVIEGIHEYLSEGRHEQS